MSQHNQESVKAMGDMLVYTQQRIIEEKYGPL